MTDLYCRICGKLRGELFSLCSKCLDLELKHEEMDAFFGQALAITEQVVADIEVDEESDRYRMQDTVRQGDRERERAVRNSDGRFYHDD